jgi:predicted alpha/beta-fold hydrolase
MDDGGTTSIDWTTPEQNGLVSKDDKLCVVYPGLSGGSDRGYIKSLVKTLIEDGYEVCVLHHRGVGDTEYTSAQFANLVSNEETFKALTYIRERTEKTMVGVGLSMGGNVIIRNAADMPNFPLKAIVSVNNPFDIWLSINLMRGTPYEKHLANEMKRNLVVREK